MTNPLPDKPAEPGNMLAAKHGATSERVVTAAAQILAENVVVEAPWLESPIFQPAIARYARAESVATLIADYVLSVGEEHPERIGARLIEASSSSLNTANRMAETLGAVVARRSQQCDALVPVSDIESPTGVLLLLVRCFRLGGSNPPEVPLADRPQTPASPIG